MRPQIAISSVQIEKLGGQTNTESVSFPSTGLVVIEGNNEAGKSTIAEAIAWLLADPTSDGESVARMGLKDESASARLEGTIDGVPFSVESKFKFQAHSRARRSSTTVIINGQVSDLETLHARCGITDPQQFHYVYRINGADGHSLRSADKALEQASAGMFGSINPREVVGILTKEAKAFGTTTAAEGDSVAIRVSKLNVLKAELHSARENSDQYSAEMASRAEAKDQASELQSQIEQLQLQAASFEAAKLIVEQQSALKVAQNSLAERPPVEPQWGKLAEKFDALNSTVQALKSQGTGLTEQVDDGERAADDRGKSVDWLAELHLDESTRNDIGSAAQTVDALRSKISLLGENITELNERLRMQAAETQRTASELGPLSEQDGFDPTIARLDEPTKVSLIGLAQQVTTSLGAVREAQGSRNQAEDAVRSEGAIEAAAVQQFEAFATGSTPEQILSGSGTNSSGSRSSTTGIVAWVPALLLLAVGVAAAVAQQFVLAGAALVGAGVAAWLVRATASEEVSETGIAPAVIEAAQAILTARGQSGQAKNRVQSAEALQGRANELLTRHQHDLVAALGSAQLPTSTQAAEVPSLLSAWTAAASARRVQLDTTKLLSERRSEERELATDLETAQATLSEMLAPFGLSTGADANKVNNQLIELSAAIKTAISARRAQSKLSVLRSQLDELLAGVGHSHSSADEALSLATEARSALAALRQEEQKVADLITHLANLRNASASASELADEYADTESLRAKERQVQQMIQELVTEKQVFTDAAAAAKNQLEVLATAESITRIQGEISSDEQAADELAVQAVTAALASALIKEAAAKEEHDRQPELINRTSELFTAVAPSWERVQAIRPADDKSSVELVAVQRNGTQVPSHQLSTGARMSLYLALRVAVADGLSDRHNASLPLLCDDPLVNIDAERSPRVIELLAEAAKDRQVIVMTCHERTSALAEQHGGTVIRLPNSAATPLSTSTPL